MNPVFPLFATECLEKIEAAGFEAWFVGGAVRDSMLGRPFYDIDITTNALPEEIIALFPKTVPTGIKHGTVTVITDGNPIEVTTYRSETGYDDSRHPNEIKFEKSIDADLMRRDFTVNALAFNPKHGILDLFGGMDDLKNGVIRAVGDPYLRFTEDALRVLRAFRFASTLGFKIEQKTEEAAHELSTRLSFLSGERVLSELKRLIDGQNPEILYPLCNRGALLPFGIGKATDLPDIKGLRSDSKTPLFIHFCSHDLKVIKEGLKPSTSLLKDVAFLDEISKMPPSYSKEQLKLIFMKSYSHFSLFCDYLAVTDKNFKATSHLICEIIDNKEPFLTEHLAISGSDLKAVGLVGEEIGKTMHRLLLAVINDPALNTKETLISLI